MTSAVSGTDAIANLHSIDASCFTSDLQRRQAIQEAQALISRLETPYETSARLNVSYSATLVCLKTALDLKLFQAWLSKNDGSPCTANELRELVPQCDGVLFARILRHLVSSNIIWEHNNDSGELLHVMTPFIRGQVENDYASQLECVFLWAAPMMMSLPEFFKKIDYANPQKASLDPVKEYTGGLSIWEYLGANEGWKDIFGRLMRATSTVRGDVMEFLQGQQLDCQSKESVLLVDIGGNQGHDLMKFHQTFEEARGRLILQDLPQVIGSIPTLDEWRIEKMSYDFFTPQPIMGAKAYLLHNIIHDWPDDKAQQILEIVAAAMDKNDSRLLIVEKVIRDTNPMMNETGMDWLMMIYGNGMESECLDTVITHDRS